MLLLEESQGESSEQALMPLSLDLVQGSLVFAMVCRCNTKSCPLFDECTKAEEGGSCGLKEKHFDNIKTTLENVLAGKGQLEKMKVGYLLMPLFHQLFVFTLELNRAEVYFGNKVNPVFREMRTIVKDIMTVLNDVGLRTTFKGLGGNKYLDGDADYYDNLLKSIG